MYKSLVFLATLAVTMVAGKHSHHEEKVERPMVMQANWNVAGTMKIVKEFEGLRLTAY